MKKNQKTEFYTLDQLDSLIDISIDDISDLLDRYVEFKGLLYDENGKRTHAEGLFVINGATMPQKQPSGEYIDSEYSQLHDDFSDLEVLTPVTGTKYSNNDVLIGNHYKIKTQHDIKQSLYSYEQFKDVAAGMSLPFLDIEKKRDSKTFNYNVQQVNQKSLFTLKEAIYIASNTDEKYALFSPSRLLEHTLQILCDCVKGQNGSGFHLVTIELWIKYYCTLNQRYESALCDVSELTPRTIIDIERTLISKSEFLRWCKFMNIETGLTADVVVENESVEYLKFENARLKKQVAKLESSLSDLVPAAVPLVSIADQYAWNKERLTLKTDFGTILVSLAFMAWMLAEKSPSFKKGNMPNSSKIQTAVMNAVEKLELLDLDNDNHKIILSKLNRDISEALKYLTDILSH